MKKILNGRVYLISSLLGVVIFTAGWQIWPAMPFQVAFLWGVVSGILTAMMGNFLNDWIEK